MELTSFEFCQEIAKDYNTPLTEKIKYYSDKFKIVNGKKKIKATYNSVIVHKDGTEYPYMNPLGFGRNDEKLVDFDYIYFIQSKTIYCLISELGLNLKTQKCKISEGNGWYTIGTRYFYKDFTCEI